MSDISRTSDPPNDGKSDADEHASDKRRSDEPPAPPESTSTAENDAAPQLADAADAGATDGNDAAAPSPKKKKKKKKKREEVALTPEEEAAEKKRLEDEREQRERKKTKLWVAAIALILSAELYTFGSRGQIEACVGREGATDFSLLGAGRTEKNRNRVPMCETRYNVGMRSTYEDSKEEALYVACRRATLIRGDREKAACFGSIAGWQKQVTTRFVWPWERPFYKRMFWFIP